MSTEDDEPTPAPPPTVLAVILAAGEGRRFHGETHKLEMQLRGRPLVWWAARHAADAGFAEVLVVEGAVPCLELVPDDVSLVHNHDWADGQARSLQVAVRYAELAGFDALVVGLGDQPFVPPEAWRRVAGTAAEIAAAEFDGQRTPPVRLGAGVWPLLPLDGDEGARQLLRGRPDLVVGVACPGSPVDVDTTSDFDKIRRHRLTKELGSWT